MQARLLEANAKQIDEPLAEVQKLLSTLLEGWCAIRTAAAVPVEAPAEASPEPRQRISCAY
jgi:flagellin-specific chaperone FliS